MGKHQDARPCRDVAIDVTLNTMLCMLATATDHKCNLPLLCGCRDSDEALEATRKRKCAINNILTHDSSTTAQSTHQQKQQQQQQQHPVQSISTVQQLHGCSNLTQLQDILQACSGRLTAAEAVAAVDAWTDLQQPATDVRHPQCLIDALGTALVCSRAYSQQQAAKLIATATAVAPWHAGLAPAIHCYLARSKQHRHASTPEDICRAQVGVCRLAGVSGELSEEELLQLPAQLTSPAMLPATSAADHGVSMLAMGKWQETQQRQHQATRRPCFVAAAVREQAAQSCAAILDRLPGLDGSGLHSLLVSLNRLRYGSYELLHPQEQRKPHLLRCISTMSYVQCVESVAAAANLGAGQCWLCVQLLRRIRASQQQGKDRSAAALMHAKLCRALAQLDLQDEGAMLKRALKCCSDNWRKSAPTAVQLQIAGMLGQAHWWLTATNSAAKGVKPMLGKSWQFHAMKQAVSGSVQHAAAAGVSRGQQQLFAALGAMTASGTWRLKRGLPRREVATQDGCSSIDIVTVSAAGTLIAWQFEGPQHFTYWSGLRNGRRVWCLELNGTSLLRNQLHAAAGYTVVSVPCVSVEPLWDHPAALHQYLQRRVDSADARSQQRERMDDALS